MRYDVEGVGQRASPLPSRYTIPARRMSRTRIPARYLCNIRLSPGVEGTWVFPGTIHRTVVCRHVGYLPGTCWGFRS